MNLRTQIQLAMRKELTLLFAMHGILTNEDMLSVALDCAPAGTNPVKAVAEMSFTMADAMEDVRKRRAEQEKHA